jgi:DNA-binding MarR family transcriptional regulator
MVTTSEATLETAHGLRLAIARTARRLRQLRAGELTPSQFSALATVHRHGPVTPSEVAALERVQRPTVTRLLARLQEEGLIARTPDPRDGRSFAVAPTDAGRALLERSRARSDAFLAQRLEQLGEADREILARATELLEQMLAAEEAELL